jgi:cytochrome c5
MVFQKPRRQMLLLVFCVLTVGTLILRAQVPLEVGKKDWATALPDGEGKGLVLGTCTQCHSLSPIALQRKTAKAWEHLVDDMIARGAQITVQEIDPITAYLTRNFGPDSAPVSLVVQASSSISQSSASPADLPDGAAKDLILKNCTSCHVLSRTTEARKTADGWRGNVRDMIRLGAKLSPNEETIVVSYLTKHFARETTTSAVASTTADNSRPSSGMSEMMARPGTSPAHLLPDDEGKALILASCVQCHATLSYVLGLRKDAEGWNRKSQKSLSST